MTDKKTDQYLVNLKNVIASVLMVIAVIIALAVYNSKYPNYTNMTDVCNNYCWRHNLSYNGICQDSKDKIRIGCFTMVNDSTIMKEVTLEKTEVMS